MSPKSRFTEATSRSMESRHYCNQPPAAGDNDVYLHKLFELSYSMFSSHHICKVPIRKQSSVTLECEQLSVESSFGHPGFGRNR
jgi:hypothetical protein